MQLRFVLHTVLYVLSVSAVMAAALNPAGTAAALRRHTRQLAAGVRTLSRTAASAPVVAASEIAPRRAGSQTKARDLRPGEYRVPIGTVVTARLRHPIDSRTARAKDQVDAVLTGSVTQDGVELIPGGSILHGTVVAAEAATKDAPRGRLEIGFNVVQHVETRSRATLRTRTLFFEAEMPAETPGRRNARRQPVDVVVSVDQVLVLTLAEPLLVYIPVSR